MLPLEAFKEKSEPRADREKVRLYTFGCKVNAADSAKMEELLDSASGLRVSHDEPQPDIVIVNTCTVTKEADRQARQLLRKVHRENPFAKIVVTGCYAEADRDFLREFEGVDEVVPISEQSKMPDLLGYAIDADRKSSPLEKCSTRTRAILKMQNGCNAYCSYCVLPYVRGRSMSAPISELVEQVRSFAKGGYQEIVLTGTHLGAYGRDLAPRIRFSDALKMILDEVPEITLRISSVEPTTLTPDLIRVVREREEILPHFHIPLQSGSDDVLKKMNRKYKARHFLERVGALAKTRKDISIGTDIITGYPGETENDFISTVDVVNSSPLTYFHVFPFSARPSTRAGNMIDDVDGTEKKTRSAILRKIGQKRRLEFYGKFLGKTIPILVEKKRDQNERLGGYTAHYVPVRFSGPDRLMNQKIDVTLKALEGEIVRGVAA